MVNFHSTLLELRLLGIHISGVNVKEFLRSLSEKAKPTLNMGCTITWAGVLNSMKKMEKRRMRHAVAFHPPQFPTVTSCDLLPPALAAKPSEPQRTVLRAKANLPFYKLVLSGICHSSKKGHQHSAYPSSSASCSHTTNGPMSDYEVLMIFSLKCQVRKPWAC